MRVKFPDDRVDEYVVRRAGLILNIAASATAAAAASASDAPLLVVSLLFRLAFERHSCCF